MSAETLRRAASLMRERAEAATEGPWHSHDGTPYYQPTVLTVEAGPSGMSDIPDGAWIAECGPDSIKGREDSEHIASWHPAVALAVADWLEAVAIRADDLADTIGSPTVAASVVKSQVFGYRNALAVAHAYLGGDA